MLTLVQAIAREEGWGIAGDIPTRDNNPGDIDAGSFAKSQPGYTGEAGRFATFDNPADGMEALRKLLNEFYIGMTLEDALNKYAPPVENQTNAYIANVSEWTGLTAQDVLTEENIG
jgi:hypothetical protein